MTTVDRAATLHEAIRELARDGCDLADRTVPAALRADDVAFHLPYLRERCGVRRLTPAEVARAARAVARQSGSTALLLVGLLVPTGRAAAADYTYTFTGQVTAVDNPNGFFTAPAAVGAPVTGSFTYTDAPSHAPFSPNPTFTNYPNGGADPHTTRMVLSVGGAEARSSASSFTNMIVGNDSPADPAPPFFPAGDSFRYSDQVDRSSPLFDIATTDVLQHPYGFVFLADPTGTAFTSRALPGGLPLANLPGRSGLIYLDDGNSEETGRLSFVIDSVRAVPEPTALALPAAAGLGLTLRRRRPC